MAGIGFELKKLFGKKGFINNIKAFSLSALAIIGPTILCLTMVTVMQLFLTLAGLGVKEQELFMATVTYSFIFSLILTNGFALLVSRYISDRIFNEEYDEIVPSFYGLATICLALGGVAGVIFYWFSPLELVFKLSAYLLFMELIIIWLLSVYVSTFKEYMRVVKAFSWGLIVTTVATGLFIKLFRIENVLSCLLGMNVGTFVIIYMLLSFMRSFLVSGEKNYFRFISYFDKYPALFFIGLFYAVGIYAHNFVFWGSHLRVVLRDTFVYCPYYDVPSFYAMLTIITGMVIFVVAVETSFYDRYKDYYSAVLGAGTLDEINRFKNEMHLVLTQEIAFAMALQLVLSLLFLIAGIVLLPNIGFSAVLLDIFKILTLGSYGCVFMFILVLVLLYFDDRKGALSVTALFLVSNLLFTGITLFLGESFYGFGFFICTMMSLGAGLIRLLWYIKRINYYTFCTQPLYHRERAGFFTKLVQLLEVLLIHHKSRRKRENPEEMLK
jgi:uncharacterized membrane protein